MITAVKTAKEWGKPPSFFLGLDGGWNDRDRILVLGYQIAQDLRCPECGNSIVVCRDPGMSGRFKVESSICYAKQAVEIHQKQPGHEQGPGEILIPVAESPDESNAGAGAGARPW